MNLDSFVPSKDQKERQNPFFEVITAEKQLWALIHSKGLLQTEVQDLYHKARSGYEKIILNDQEEVGHQDVEYSLWKLHYKHIDEFRKRIRPTTANAESIRTATPQNVANVQSSIDFYTEGFKSFLSDATKFYEDLIVKLRRQYGLPEDPLLHDKGGVSCTVDTTKLDRCHYSCHRLLICLGDLARYGELCKKLDSESHNWSVAADYYFKATLVRPDSGNPQNQLALLATYIRDDFLALYHCIRSLAIKEPFPDAWDNLILLLEKNRSSHLPSVCKEAHFNFSNPSERSTSPTESQSSCGSLSNGSPEATDHISSTKSDLWPLFVRMTSFFFIESRLEEFPCTFASTMRELDILLALDDNKLKSSLESYQHMDSPRTGPYRALQMVSILIFIVNSLTSSTDHKESKEKNYVHQPILIKHALTATFICLGRIIERCLKGNRKSMELSPLLPAVLVFAEWLVGTLDKLETYGGSEEVGSAISYFVDAFVDLLNRLDKDDGESKCRENTALWEDYELRGFASVSHAHGSLDFMSNPKLIGSFDSRIGCRVHRIFRAAMEIVKRSDGSRKLIFYDDLGRKFSKKGSENSADQKEAEGVESGSDLGVKTPAKQKNGAAKENGKSTIGENVSHPFGNGKSAAIEEEEVILFKPITRYNSAPPLYTSATHDKMSMEVLLKDQSAPSDESLRRASSLFAAQNPTQIDPSSFHFDASSFGNKPVLIDSDAYTAGPPSLSSWVFNRESSNTEQEKKAKDCYKLGLTPIEEVASESLADLSISEPKGSLVDSPYVPPPPPPPPPQYMAPVPSAPLLPDDAIWFTRNPSSFSEVKSSGNYTKETGGILGGPLISSYPNLGYPPVIGMSSSEWLYQYSNQNLDRASSQAWPVHFYAPGRLGSFYGHDGSRFDLCDRWGNPLGPPNPMVYSESPQGYSGSPLVYGADDERRQRFLHNFERPTSPYGCGAGTDIRAEQPQLLQYLKEKEWQLQQQAQVRGPAYIGN